MTAMTGMVLAQMGDGGDHMGRGWWWVMGIGWLIFLAVVVVLVVLVVRHFTADAPRRGNAEDLLAQRFARGEIDEEEYRNRRAALRD
jgi:putative membrane protein